MTNFLIGQRFGRLVVIERAAGRRWKCSCDCGEARDVRGDLLVGGLTRSCGCIRKENPPGLVHGHARDGGSPEYIVWQGMIQRCGDPSFDRYAGAGILVCERWR